MGYKRALESASVLVIDLPSEKYIEIDRFADQFWKLIHYVEQFDTYLTTEFRRIEKLLTTGE